MHDPVLELSDMVKEQEGTPEAFVRQVTSAPEFTVFLSTDRQLLEMEKFCTNPEMFSIVGVDTTFNLGDYFVTLTTYRNLMFKTKAGTEPVMIGPAIIHQRKLFESYHTLPSNMVKYHPPLKNLLVFGTDGEVNLYQAFQVTMEHSVHLLCDLHMFDNIKSKLNKLGIPKKDASLYLRDIFGKNEGDEKVKGLVDCTTAEEFEKTSRTYRRSG